MFDVQISTKRMVAALLSAFGLLFLAHMAVAVVRVEYGFDYVYGLAPKFDFDRPISVPDWFTSLLFLVAALMSVLSAKAAAKLDRGQGHRWVVLGALMLLASVDGVAALHQHVVAWALGDAAPVFGRWTLAYAPMVLVLGLWFVPLLVRLPRSTALALALSALLFVGAAIGLELAGAGIAEGATNMPVGDISKEQWAEIKRTWPYVIAATLEESIEMCAVILYVVAVAGYLSRRGVRFRVSY